MLIWNELLYKRRYKYKNVYIYPPCIWEEHAARIPLFTCFAPPLYVMAAWLRVCIYIYGYIPERAIYSLGVCIHNHNNLLFAGCVRWAVPSTLWSFMSVKNSCTYSAQIHALHIYRPIMLYIKCGIKALGISVPYVV